MTNNGRKRHGIPMHRRQTLRKANRNRTKIQNTAFDFSKINEALNNVCEAMLRFAKAFSIAINTSVNTFREEYSKC